MTVVVLGIDPGTSTGVALVEIEGDSLETLKIDLKNLGTFRLPEIFRILGNFLSPDMGEFWPRPEVIWVEKPPTGGINEFYLSALEIYLGKLTVTPIPTQWALPTHWRRVEGLSQYRDLLPECTSPHERDALGIAVFGGIPKPWWTPPKKGRKKKKSDQ